MQFNDNLFGFIGFDDAPIRFNQVETWPIDFKLDIKYEILYSIQM